MYSITQYVELQLSSNFSSETSLVLLLVLDLILVLVSILVLILAFPSVCCKMELHIDYKCMFTLN